MFYLKRKELEIINNYVLQHFFCEGESQTDRLITKKEEVFLEKLSLKIHQAKKKKSFQSLKWKIKRGNTDAKLELLL